MKETFDTRGSQLSIFRLSSFDRPGLLHAVSIRVLTFVSLIAAVVLAVNLVYGTYALWAHLLLVIVWLLITPQLFELTKGLIMMATRGRVYGHLNRFWLDAQKKEGGGDFMFYAAPYAALAVWLLLLVIVATLWFT